MGKNKKKAKKKRIAKRTEKLRIEYKGLKFKSLNPSIKMIILLGIVFLIIVAIKTID
jgi:hypothetical protein